MYNRVQTEETNKLLSIFLWSLFLVLIGFFIGYFTQSKIDDWYSLLNRSPLTPANDIFPVVWTFLYVTLGIAGWIIWNRYSYFNNMFIKILYLLQLILNYSWSVLFFNFQMVAIALIVLIMIDIFVAMIIYVSYKNMKLLSIILMPYCAWVIFATYLNYYILQYN